MNKPFRFDLQTFADGEPNGENGGNQNPDPAGNGKSAGDDLTSKSAEELAEYARGLRKAEASTRAKLDAAEKERKDLKAWRDERETKDLEEQKNFKDLADRERSKREKLEKDMGEKLAAKDQRTIRAEVRAAAIKAGIVDPKDANNFDIKDLRLTDDDEVPGIEEFIAAQKSAKPHWFSGATASNQPSGTGNNAGTPPPVTGGNNGGDGTQRDWRGATSADVLKEVDRLLTQR